MNNKFLGIAAVALATLGLGSCTNEFNGLSMQNGNYSGLAKSTDIVAWSGSQILYDSHTGTRADFSGDNADDFSYPWAFPVEMDYVRDIEIPADAKWYQEYQSDGVYKVAEGNYAPVSEWDKGLKFNGGKVTLYLLPGAKVKEIGSNFSNITIYICKGAELEISDATTGSWAIYNAGKFTFKKAAFANLKNIYSTGDIVLKGGQDSWNQDIIIADDASIYMDGGVLEIEAPQVYLNGKIIANNIVKFSGDVSVQSSKCDICELIIKNKITLPGDASPLTIGNLKAREINECGGYLKLHPNGLVDITESIFSNNGKLVEAYDNNSKGLVKCPNIELQNQKSYEEAFGAGIYVNGTIKTGQGVNIYNPDRLNVANEEEFIPSCASDPGSEGGTETPTPTPTPTPDPVDPEEPKDPDPKEPEEPKTPDPVDPTPQLKYCPECGHVMIFDEVIGVWVHHEAAKADGDCKECEPGATVCHPTNEVEVNLAVNDQHIQYGINDLVAKLSIHVRMPGDVEIRIPIPKKYCESDDLYIFNDHSTNVSYGGQKGEITEMITFNVIEGHPVTLTVRHEDDEIIVTTAGIDDEVFKYCVNNFGDGINFELYLYLNDGILLEDGTSLTKDKFKTQILDNSTIKFLDLAPDYYINAFNKTLAGSKFGMDCEVDIINTQKGQYEDPVEAYHLNGSPYNQIYKNKAEEKEGVEHDHGFLWNPYEANHPDSSNSSGNSNSTVN